MDIRPPQVKLPRSLLLSGFIIGAIWLVSCFKIAATLAQSAVNRLNRPALEPVLEQALLFLCAIGGLQFLDWLLFRAHARPVRAFFPARPTASQEAQRGIALGWGAALLTVLPLLAFGAMHPQFTLTAGSILSLLLAICTLAIAALTTVLAFQGYLLRWMRATYGPTPAMLFVSALYAILWAGRWNAGSGDYSIISVAAAFLFSLLLCSAYRRTHALWLTWGLRLAWSAAFAILLGLPFSGVSTFNGIVATATGGPRWLTGGVYGPDGSLIAIVVLLVAVPVLYRVTHGYAWEYTHEPIVGRAYAVVVQPPPAHTAMEQAAAAAPAPLVQILATTPGQASSAPEIDRHLRADPDTRP